MWQMRCAMLRTPQTSDTFVSLKIKFSVFIISPVNEQKRREEIYALSDNFTPQLGLVCITTSDAVRYHALTRKRLLQFDASEQKRRLRELYADNLARLNGALDFCHERGLKLYRLTSGLFPFADDETGADVLEEFRTEARRTGERATTLGIRLVIHPDQFVVLSSDSEQVVANSIKILETHAHVLDLLAQPRTSWTVIEIHGGKGDRAKRLARVIQTLPDAIRTRHISSVREARVQASY